MFKTQRYLPALLLSAGVLVAAPACASYGYYGNQRNDVYRDVERRAYDNGYRDGVKKGEEDGRKGRAFLFDRHGDWRDADDGYHRDYGDREFYRRVFRRGFESGYTEGFNRYRRGYGYGTPQSGYGYGTPQRGYGYPTPSYGYPSSVPAYSSPAAQIGYRDGYEVGRNDARDRESFDPVRSRRYRSGDHDYDRRYGSKDEYKRVYRDAFQRGYEQGYREYRRY
jgi:hypothetical protein